MKTYSIICGILLLVALAESSVIVKREAEDAGAIVKRETEEDLSPLNEVYVFETDEDQSAEGDRGDRDKRKVGVGIVKLGVTNGILNFVFGKLDSFLDAKTKALVALDDSNRAKNAAYGIDNTHSATGQFLSHLVSQKIQATAGSIGPIINSATTLVSGTKSGLTSAFLSKLAPLSSITSGVVSGVAQAGAAAAGGLKTVSVAPPVPNHSAILGNLLTSKINTLTGLSQSSGGGGGGGSDGTNAGINLGAFANLGGGGTTPSTTTEDIPEFDRSKVSLDVPPQAFGTGFTVITNVSKVLSNLIFNSARRTQTLLEVFKPFFRGTFAIKGLPSDDP